MISAGSKVPNIRDTCDLRGTRGDGLWRSQSAAPLALALLSGLLLQGCGTSEPKGIADADPAAQRASLVEGQSVIPRGPGTEYEMAASSRHVQDDRYPRDTFADRYSAVQGYAPSVQTYAVAQPPRQAMLGPQPTRETVFGPPAREASFGPNGVRAATITPPAASYRVAALSPAMPSSTSPVKQANTQLIGFDNSAFPYSGKNPRSGGASRYNDNRVLVHVPAGFDVRKPAVIVVFFHGHGATLARDVRDRQLLPKQITESGVNAVLVAPQLAYDAADSSAGKFWERDGLKRFMAEAADRLAQVYGDPASVDAFAKMPVIIVAYSGGFETAAWSLQIGGLGKRVAGVVLLDALYGHVEKFASWIARNRHAFFVSAYTQYTKRRDDELAQMLRGKGIPVQYELDGPLKPGTAAFLSTPPSANHRDYVTQAWTTHPVKDVLVRISQR
jgi:hypothetical protein